MAESTSFHPRKPPLPGFGLPQALVQDMKNLFVSVFDTYLGEHLSNSKARLLALTLRELSMFINEVTDKREWETKVFDESITEKWKSEVTNNPDLDFTQKMADYCIEEMKYKAQILKETGIITVYNGGVIKSDTTIPVKLQSLLREAITQLENVPSHQKDWHPGSNGQVLDLVHPSLFPLVYGVSRILKDDTVGLDDFITRCGEGEVIKKEYKPFGGRDHGKDICHYIRRQLDPYSEKFQWLPCDIDILGEHPKIVGYINNLHPKHHKELYSAIEKIVEKVIPVWNATLTPLKRQAPSQRIGYDEVKYDEEALNRFMDVHGPVEAGVRLIGRN